MGRRRWRASSSCPSTPRKVSHSVEPSLMAGWCELQITALNCSCIRRLFHRVVEFDKSFSAWVHNHGLDVFFSVFWKALEFSGDGLFLIPSAAATFLAPDSKLTPEARMFVFNLFMAFVFDLIFVSIIKKVVRRRRPSYNRKQSVSAHVDRWSFPSGHSTRALMLLTMFGLYLPLSLDQSRRVWLPTIQKNLAKQIHILPSFVPTAEILLIISLGGTVTAWAIATTSSRIILGRHFFCDVVAGSLLGILEALFAFYVLAIPVDTTEEIHRRVSKVLRMGNSTWAVCHGKHCLVHETLPPG